VVMLIAIRDPFWTGVFSPIHGGMTAAVAWLVGSRSTMGPMPVYEFECEGCGSRFEELAPSDTRSLPCPECGSERTRRLMSPVSPAGRQPRGPAVRSDESRRGESQRKRAAGESVRPQRGGGGT
jgi:putative FmdB family regulatory protein